MLQNNYCYSWHPHRSALWDIFRLSQFWLYLVYNALPEGVCYWVAMLRQSIWALPENILRPFFWICSKDIWWDQGFDANCMKTRNYVIDYLCLIRCLKNCHNLNFTDNYHNMSDNDNKECTDVRCKLVLRNQTPCGGNPTRTLRLLKECRFQTLFSLRVLQ